MIHRVREVDMSGMVVGICKLEIQIEDNFSLKGKRSIVKKIIHRVRNQYNAAVAEVEDMDCHDHAILGFAVVANEAGYVDSKIRKMLNFIEDLGLAPISQSDFTLENY
jgi:uncharacterized protein